MMNLIMNINISTILTYFLMAFDATFGPDKVIA